MRRRLLYRLVPALLVAGALGYLFSLYPKPDMPADLYRWTPFLVVALAALVLEMVLLAGQSEDDLRKQRNVWDEEGDRTWVVRTPRRGVGSLLALAAFVLGQFTMNLQDFEMTVSAIAYLQVATLLIAAALLCGSLIGWAPRRTGRALLVIGGLLLVVAVLAPVVRPLEAGWMAEGLHLMFFMLGSAVLTLAAGVVALVEARHPGEAPDLRFKEPEAA